MGLPFFFLQIVSSLASFSWRHLDVGKCPHGNGERWPSYCFWVLAEFHEVPLALPACHELLKATATKTRDLFSLALTQCHRLSPGHPSTSEPPVHPPPSSASAGYHTVALHTHCGSCLSAISLIPHCEHIRTSRPLSCCVQPEMIPNTGDKIDKSEMG